MPQADADVFVYRDTGVDWAAQDSAERTAAYWYDLLAEDLAPAPEETRGPFEPLMPSSAPPPEGTRQHAAGRDAAGPAGARQASAGPVRDEGAEGTAHARARKLEQIKDLYLTAEAIGEQNVDKHFDQLLARQRELISEYFRQPATAAPGVAGPRDSHAAEAAAGPHDRHDPGDPGRPGRPDGQAGPPEGAGVAAEPPRAW